MLKLSFDFQLLTEVNGEDNREPGYSLLFAAAGALADSDPVRHGYYCSVVASHAQAWLSAMQPGGFWAEKDSQYPYDPIGVSPWREFSVVQALARSYDVLEDAGVNGCGNPGLADRVLSALKTAGAYAFNAGYDRQSRGVYYDVEHLADGLTGSANLRPGAVAVPLNSVAVTGTGTHFLTDFACNGADYIGIYDQATNNTWAYQVASCQDDTDLTLAKAFGVDYVLGVSVTTGTTLIRPSGDLVAAAYYEVPATTAQCNSSAGHCYPATGGDRNSNRDLIWISGWLYSRTGDSQYKAYGDELFAATYGGPAGGPGTSGPCGGPACDGVQTDYSIAIHGCVANPALPCSQSNYPHGNAFVWRSKRWAQGSGIGGADNYLAWRTGAN
jgi:hypothetical protein